MAEVITGERASHLDVRADAMSRALPWVAILIGSLLRVLWPLDMEWKGDEKWMFAKAERVAHGLDAWPTIGMPSGAGIENPGLSIWPFAAIAHVARDPIAMNMCVEWLNVLVLWGFALWVLRTWPEAERKLGLWGVALFAISPLPVLFSRKIWAQDLLVLCVLPWLWGHARRTLRGGAFAWGLFGALLGQLHMSGFFAAASLFLATLIYDRKRVAWVSWSIGSVCGSLTLVPWLRFMLEGGAAHAPSKHTWSLAFFADAVRNAFGLALRYPLQHAHEAYVAAPVWFGHATHLNLLARLFMYGVLALAIGLAIRERKALALSPLVRIYLVAVGIGGLLMTVAGVRVYPHYLIAWSPLLHIGAVWLVRRHRALLVALCAGSLYMTVSFMGFIHAHGGAPRSDYGTTYRTQTPVERRVAE